MKKEDKELILKDICSRLPYNIKCYYEHNGTKGHYHKIVGVFDNVILANGYQLILGIDTVKIYIRSMSSMTEDERNEYFSVKMRENERVALAETYRPEAISEIMDWLNSHHFDYRGLIERGLAIEVDKDFYK